ncbi:molybdenum cofactor sulfurase-like [Humulus lupulus]|uniref:molybdenum cofactor sulfurase-like n=1 Tax=Humulus lupulus TaxID=3486 RepID=UPI002B4004E3|nr:molybdenum cofactor sulfurase-like [Humulus lupulus]
MNSPCIGEASEACFHGCCRAPSFVSLHSPKSPTSTSSTITTASTSQYHFTMATLSSLPNITPYFTNHESLPGLRESFSYFVKAFPLYSQTHQTDQIRSHEYQHLQSHVCLDYVGIGLFSYSQQQRRRFDPAMASSSSYTPLLLDFHESHFFDICYKAVSLKSQMVFNRAMMSQEPELELKLRKRIMAFMNVSEDDYFMVFTSNQSSAFKLLADSYPFQSNRNLLTVYDYKSEGVEAMVESSKKRGARVNSAEFSWPHMKLQSKKLRKMVLMRGNKNNKGLFVFPLQSRMTGSRYSYLWMSLARENGWHVLLDACALGPKDMETLGLSLFQPDFLICSFFKVFGENPSGFGCLFVKKTTSSILDDSTPASTIGIVSLVQNPLRKDEFSESKKSEIDDECRGLDHADSLGLVLISTRARILINWVVNALSRLKHPNSENGHSLIRIYGPKIGYDRGPSVAFNLFDWKGEKVDPALVQKLADRNNISLSCGFLQNFWFEDKIEEERELRLEKTGFVNKESDKRERCGICVVMASIGLITNFDDIYRLWGFVSRFLDADYVEKERWRYLALNQTTIEV